MFRRRCAAVAFVGVAVAIAPACGPSSASARQELCSDVSNLQPTVDLLATPPADATVGDVRGALEKIDSTLQAIHDETDVPDAQDDALLDAKDAYDDAIQDFGDDDAFAPHAAAAAGIASGLADAYAAARASLACQTDPPDPA
jgi:hypothetical protein